MATRSVGSGLGRPIDPRYPSNRFAMVAAAAAATIAGLVVLVDGGEVGDAAGWAARAGIAVFLAWAIARELDPDDSTSAAVATPAALLALLAGPPNLAAGFAVLLAVRVVVRTTGLWPQPIDLVFLVGLAGYAGYQGLGIVAAAVLALAIGADTLLPRPAPAFHSWVGVAALGAAIGGFALGGDWPAWDLPGGIEVIVLVLGVAGVLALRSEIPTSLGDHRNEPLDGRRLLAGRLVGMGAALTFSVAAGGSGIAALTPLWAALAATGALSMTRSRRVRGRSANAPRS